MITSTANPRVKWIRALQGRRRTRWQEGHFVVEGMRLAEEVVRAGVPVTLVLHTDHLDDKERGVVNNLARQGAEVAVVSDEVMLNCSDTETPQGLLAALPMPGLEPPADLDWALVVDRFRDPGNLGTLLRTALGAGVGAAFLMPGTVDPYNPKVVRGAMGAHLRLPLLAREEQEILAALHGLGLWVAEPRLGLTHWQVDWRAPCALIMGGEAQGPREVWEKAGARHVHVPMPGQIESLNAAVAGGVILFEIAGQRGRS
jgi:TrmH family RNA methyltransferase